MYKRQPLICAALLSAFWGSWIPVAIYMSGMALISLVAARMAPETLDRDLTVPEDAGAQVEYRGGAQSG